MRLPYNFLLVGLLLGSVCACTMNAPKYTPISNNVNDLRDGNLEPANVGQFASDSSAQTDVNQLSIRGGSYVSPYGGSFVNYLREALRQELEEARLYNPSSSIEISGILIRNELDTGVATAHALIEARVIIKRKGEVCYDKIKTARHEWESHFFANIAVPRSQENYPTAVQKLLTSLYSDPDFLKALRK